MQKLFVTFFLENLRLAIKVIKIKNINTYSNAPKIM